MGVLLLEQALRQVRGNAKPVKAPAKRRKGTAEAR
jgi:hypothetical protein